MLVFEQQRPSRQGSVNSTSSFNLRQHYAGERDLSYYDDTLAGKTSNESDSRKRTLESEQRDSFSSLGQQSIDSKMDSLGSSSKCGQLSRMSEDESLAYSLATNNSSDPTPLDLRSSTSMTSRKAPPPSNYRLSRMSLKKPPPSYDSTNSTQRSQQNLKKPPPPSSLIYEEDARNAINVKCSKWDQIYR